MTNVISGAFITSDSIGADKRGQGLMTEMTETTMQRVVEDAVAVRAVVLAAREKNG
jgi:hypothetical protein